MIIQNPLIKVNASDLTLWEIFNLEQREGKDMKWFHGRKYLVD